MMRMHKTCAQCGAQYPRHRKFGKAQWAASTYCSLACSGKAATAHNAAERPSLRDKFNTMFAKSEGCWEWEGTIEGYGYGVIDHDWKRYRAHVLALEFDGRPVPAGMKACHHCDNPRCVRPSHLYVGTTQDNSNDAVERGKQPKGSQHHRAKLDEGKVAEMRGLDGTYASIAQQYGVSRPTATRAIKGKSWRHVQ